MINKICKHCKQEILNTRKGKIFCSKECKIKYHVKNKTEETKERDRERKNKKRKELKELIIQKKGGKCKNCGYDRCLNAFDLHHRDPKSKEISFNSLIGHDWSSIEDELKVCDLLCSNCHRIEHSFLNEDRIDYQNKLRMFLYKQAGNECGNCKITDKNTFDFHHIQPERKRFSISKAIASRWDIHKIKNEVEKCSLLCSNCHREHHSVHFFENIKIKPIVLKQNRIDLFLEKVGKEKICKTCSLLFFTTRHSYFFCSNHCENNYNTYLADGKYIKICQTCNNQFFTINKNKLNCNDCTKTETKALLKRRKNKNKVNSQKYSKKCKSCDGEFLSSLKNVKYCSHSCMIYDMRKDSMKDLDNVKDLYIKNDYNLTKTANLLIVSDNALKKQLKKYFPDE